MPVSLNFNKKMERGSDNSTTTDMDNTADKQNTMIKQ